MRPRKAPKDPFLDLLQQMGPFFDVGTLVSSVAPVAGAALNVPFSELIMACPWFFGFLSYLSRKSQDRELFDIKPGEPYVFLGRDEKGLPIRINFEVLKRHLLVLGTTGSGKTVTLRALSFLHIWLGGGLTFVDGKSDVTDTYEPFYSMACAAGREKDFLVLNFLDPTQSNTWNPLVDKNADTDYCVEVLAGLLPPASGDQTYWRGRGIALMRGIMACLIWLRDHRGRQFDIWEVKSHLAFGKALELLDMVIREEIPLRDNETGRPVGELLLSYFEELGPWHEVLAEQRLVKSGKPVAQKGGGKGPRAQLEVQHNYAAQQWTDALGLLGGTFAPIFAAKKPDIEMEDVITNSRILYVLLPSLGKSKDTLESMGRMVLTAIRMSLFQLLGKEVVGEYEEIKKKVKVKRPSFPHLGIFDEFGSYMVSGFSDVVAQARSLGYSAVFAGQEIGRFMKKDEGEAKALFGNTGVKIIMRTVDTDTSKFVVDLASEDWYLMPATVKESDAGVATYVYVDGKERRLEKRPNIEVLDLARLGPGQAFFITKDGVRRGQIFYVKPEKTPKYFSILKPRKLQDLIYELRAKKKGQELPSYRVRAFLLRMQNTRYNLISPREAEEILGILPPPATKFLALPPYQAAGDPGAEVLLQKAKAIEEEIRDDMETSLEGKEFRSVIRPSVVKDLMRRVSVHQQKKRGERTNSVP